jgi:hypothetical protein
MGYPAVWTPSDGSAAQTGVVLLNRPTQKEEISDEDYAAVATKCEYLEGLFPGLFEAVQSAKSEPINVAGIDYYAYKADRKFDGKTIILQLEPKR